VEPFSLIHAVLQAGAAFRCTVQYVRRKLPRQYVQNPRIPFLRSMTFLGLAVAGSVTIVYVIRWFADYVQQPTPEYLISYMGLFYLLGAAVFIVYALVKCGASCIDWVRSKRANRALGANPGGTSSIEPA
jgi:hypothetical protein